MDLSPEESKTTSTEFMFRRRATQRESQDINMPLLHTEPRNSEQNYVLLQSSVSFQRQAGGRAVDKSRYLFFIEQLDLLDK